MIDLNCNIVNVNFKQKGGEISFKSPQYSAGQFINDVNKIEEQRLKGNFIARNFGSPTAYWGSIGIILLGELACMAKVHSVKNLGLLVPKLKKTLVNKMAFALGATTVAGITFGVAVQKWQKKLIDKKSSRPQELLEQYGRDTSAKLANNNLRSTLIAAQYNIINGTIEVNKNYIHDPIGKKLIEKYIKHELQHARQFEMIAGLDNGLEKLNYACVHNIADYLKKNPITIAQMKDIINEINNDILGRYNNVKIPLSGAEVDFKNYVKALEILINNPQAKPEDIPMIIDVEHYKKAIAKRGALSEKEKEKAEEYYQALLKYPVMTGFNLLNPFSGYRSNVLEKEARMAGRSKNGKIE